MKNWTAFSSVFHFVTGYKIDGFYYDENTRVRMLPVEQRVTDWYFYKVEKPSCEREEFYHGGGQ